MYFVYILHSAKLNKRYIGYSTNLKQGMDEHKAGKSKYTSKSNDWQLVYYEVFKSSKDARREETFLKTGRGRDRLQHLLQSTFE